MNLAGLVGEPDAELEERLGEPDARREAGGDLWLIYRRSGSTLRVRCVDREDRGAEGVRVASWTLTWEEPRPTLRAAVAPLGLWPACAPDVDAAEVRAGGGRRVRRALADPSGRRVLSLTAGVTGGGFERVAAFDEAPDWT